MSWAYPRHAFNDGDVLDFVKLNDTFRAYSWEAAQLTESNWAAGAITELKADGKVADDAGCTIFGNRTNGVAGVNPFSLGSNESDIPQTSAWSKVPNSRKEFQTRGGMAYIMASFQLGMDADVNQPGLQFCIGIDDDPRVESLIGSVELSNNRTQRPKMRYPYPTTSSTNQATPPAAPAATSANYRGTGPAIKSENIALCTHLVAYLSPGTHVVTLQVRQIASSNDNAGNAYTQHLSQHQFFIFDFWANPGR